MSPTSRLYDALSRYLSQCGIQWQDARHLQTLCWMLIGMIESQNVHLNSFGVYVTSRAKIAQSHQRRFRRWLSNRRIDVVSAHHALVGQALSEWGSERLYLSLDTTVVWKSFLHRLGGRGVSGQNGSHCLASRGTSQQHGTIVDDSESVAPISASPAPRGHSRSACRPRLC